MLCNTCNKRTAVYHLISIFKSELIEIHLCEQCYKTANHSSVQPDNLDKYNSILDALIGKDIEKELEEKYCPKCGTSIVEFRHSEILGCSNCYNVFKDEIKKKYSVNKEGYRNSGIKTIDDIQNIKKLKDELKRALQNEQYEKAAIIRDRLKKYTAQSE